MAESALAFRRGRHPDKLLHAVQNMTPYPPPLRQTIWRLPANPTSPQIRRDELGYAHESHGQRPWAETLRNRLIRENSRDDFENTSWYETNTTRSAKTHDDTKEQHGRNTSQQSCDATKYGHTRRGLQQRKSSGKTRETEHSRRAGCRQIVKKWEPSDMWARGQELIKFEN